MVAVIACTFIAYGGYALWSVYQSAVPPSIPSVAVALLAIIGGIGLLNNRRWSQYCIYVTAAAVSGTWAYLMLTRLGREWVLASITEAIISLIPGLCLVTIGIGGSYVVFKHFRNVGSGA